MQMTNRELTRIHTALVILGNRRMGNLGADLKVGRLLRVSEALVDILQRKRVEKQQELLGERTFESLTKEQREDFDLTLSAFQEDMNAETVEVAFPMAYALKEIDLPKEQTGAEGWRNAAQIGALVSDLGPLYVMDQAE